MYTVTSDFKHYISLRSLDQAKRLADNIKGGVFIIHHREVVCLYSYRDGE